VEGVVWSEETATQSDINSSTSPNDVSLHMNPHSNVRDTINHNKVTNSTSNNYTMITQNRQICNTNDNNNSTGTHHNTNRLLFGNTPNHGNNTNTSHDSNNHHSTLIIIVRIPTCWKAPTIEWIQLIRTLSSTTSQWTIMSYSPMISSHIVGSAAWSNMSSSYAITNSHNTNQRHKSNTPNNKYFGTDQVVDDWTNTIYKSVVHNRAQ
jgi:hypothetical protein